MSGIPLGKREDLHLEFKAAEALKDPEKIAREVVAMLNAEGGEVWVGLREEDGVAVAVEEIPEPEVSRQGLKDLGLRGVVWAGSGHLAAVPVCRRCAGRAVGAVGARSERERGRRPGVVRPSVSALLSR